MTFKCWRLKKLSIKRAKEVYYSTLLVWIRNTLIYNMLKMTILVFIIIYILFKFLPHTAHISFESSERSGFISIAGTETSNIYAESGDITLSVYEDKSDDFSDSKKSINLRTFSNFIVNGETLPEGTNICLEVADTYGEMILSFDKNEGKQDSYTTLQANLPDELADEPNIDFQYSMEKEFDIVKCSFNYGVNIYFPKETEIELKGIVAKVQTPDGVEIDLKKFVINTCVMDIPLKTSFVDLTYELSKYLFIMDGINNLVFKGDGELFFSNTPSSQQYSLKNQDLELKGSDDFLKAYKLYDDSNINFSGEVVEASLSNMNLFPSLRGWYRDNIYLAPLSLISIVFGSISLLKSKQKEKK